MMNNNFKGIKIINTLKILIISVLIVLSIGSCGGGSNNDQGNSVTFLQWNAVDDEGACDPDVGLDTIFIPTDALSDAFPQSIFTCATVVNNMCSQGVRIDRALISYYAEGSEIAIPDTTVPLSALLGKNGNCTSGTTSSLPAGFTNIIERQMTINTVPAQILEYLALNQESLPEPPYNLNIIVKLSGVTTSGQRITTNELYLLGVVATSNPFNPTSSSSGLTDISQIETVSGIDSAAVSGEENFVSASDPLLDTTDVTTDAVLADSTTTSSSRNLNQGFTTGKKAAAQPTNKPEVTATNTAN